MGKSAKGNATGGLRLENCVVGSSLLESLAMEPPIVLAGRYDVQSALGQGSFGRTLLARDRQLERSVAIKVFESRGSVDWKAYEMFEREAAVLKLLRHHGIPEVIDSFRDKWNGADAPFLVMEYVDGTSLAQLIESGRHLEHVQVMHVLLELLGILEYLHGRVPPILHRDIKPSNIILRPSGFPALVDFGSVRRVFLAHDESGSTVAGTYGYMPYEQYMGQASPSSDLYSVGATMLHLVTGRAPKEFMNSEGRIEPPADIPGDERFRRVISRMLRPVPLERYQSAAEVRKELLMPTSALAMETVAAPSVAARVAGRKAIVNRKEFPPAPRAVTGIAKERFEQIAYPWWRYADASSKVGDEGYGILSLTLFGFFSIVTVGILPAVFFGIGRTRRRRLKRFFANGTQGIAEITGMVDSPTAFGEKLTRVSYEFEADGQLRRDSDLVLPIVAGRWRTGDQIEVLYLPEPEYDSVIISG